VGDGDGGGLVAGLPSAQQTALVRLLPELPETGVRVGDADTERLLLLEGAVGLLAAASQGVAVLVVLDDLHWADAASLQLLRHLTAATTPMKVTVACAYRDTDVGRGDPLNKLLADLHREANVARVALTGLEDSEVVDLLEAAAGHTLNDRGIGLAHALRRETDGNPFFTAEMLRHLGESGGIVLGDDGRWTVAGGLEDLGLPSSVRDVVGRRVERLGDETVQVLSLAAVIGREFDITLLAALAGMDEDGLVEIVDAAVAAAVLVESAEGGRYRFAHALIQHALYDDLSVTRRQRVHQRIAEALETDTTPADPADLAELARHWMAATRPVELNKAVRYARLAADAAKEALAPEDAIRWYQQALDLVARQPTPNQRTRAELLTALGAEQRRAAHPEYRNTLLHAAEVAQQLDASDLLVDTALAFSQQAQLGADEAAKTVAGAALNAMTTHEGPARARVLAVLADAHDYSLEWREWRRLSLEALDVARRSGDEAVLASVIFSTSNALGTPDRRSEYLDDINFAVRLADHIGDPALRAQSRYLSVDAGYRAVDIAAVDTAIAELGALSGELGLPYQRWRHALAVTGRLIVAGQADKAEAANDDALQAGLAAGTPDALGVFGGVLYLVRWQQGRLDELVDFFIDVARENPSIAALRATIPTMLCQVGRIEEARTHLAAEAANGFEFPYDTLQWPIAMLHFADSAASVGDRTGAQRLIEILAPFDTDLACPAPSPVGALARPLARIATVLGDYDQAERWFATADDIHARLQAPFWTALGQLDYADLCMVRCADGDLARARQRVTTAAATATQYNYAGLTTRAETLLTQL
jgi:tetratricopeptide (TPR) repeat protein